MHFADDSTIMTLERLYAQVSSDNPYKILGVSEDCKDGEIKYNYRQLADYLDPDKVPHEDLADYHVELFRKVESAYDQLILRYTARDPDSEPSFHENRERKPAKTTNIVTDSDSDSEPPPPPRETRKKKRARRAKDSYLEDFFTLEQAVRAKTMSKFSIKSVEDYYAACEKQAAPVEARQVRNALPSANREQSWAEKMLREQRQIDAEVHRQVVAQALWEEEQDWDDEYDEDEYGYEEDYLDEYENLSKKDWRYQA
ncbi:hypothetical protein AC578_10894 [Pseudocercospora eumusae]|uniref:J domain-containing protein n=1 Tax=Pseudocercospora eumusae TaxID=321146 RepID=A0A139HFA4_9PEZI|nr:hypothetical protein AC578_10894 [Pseudocercospora eumusae]